MRTSTRHVRATHVLLFALLLSLAAPGIVLAHAEFVSADPAADATVEGTPERIVATFSEAVVADGSSLQLRGPDGETIATGTIDPEDPTRLVITDPPDLAPGEHEVRWTVASDDGHLERGRYRFTVAAAPTSSPTTEPTSAPTATAAVPESPAPSPTAPQPSPTPAEEPATDTADVLLPILGLLVVLAVLAAVLFGRRRTGTPR